MTRKERVAADIERRIEQRDRLWAVAQGAPKRAGLDVIDIEVAASESRRLADRVERLEDGLARFLDPEWLAAATPAELGAHAREVLRSRTGATPPGGSAVIAANVETEAMPRGPDARCLALLRSHEQARR